MQHRTSHAVTTVKDLVPQPHFDDDELEYKKTRGEWTPLYGYSSEELLNIWYDRPPTNKKGYDMLYSLLTRYSYNDDGLISIANDIHNNKAKHPDHFLELSNTIRKSKSKNLRDFVDKVKEKLKKEDDQTS